MAFHGFSAEGVDLLQLNRLQNSKEFYDAHKDEIKRLSTVSYTHLDVYKRQARSTTAASTFVSS